MSVLRRLVLADAPALLEHLLRLDPEARHDRFGGYASDASIERYCQGINWLEDILVGWIQAGEIRAAVQLVVTAGAWPREGELALSVERGWQNRGVGTALCRRLTVLARNRAITRVCMACLRGNVRMQRIARKIESLLAFDDGWVEGRLRLPLPNQLSFLQEAVGEGGGMVGSLADQWQGRAAVSP